MDDLRLALAHYRMMFPTLASLGAGAETWKKEYDRVAEEGLSATLITSTGGDGATVQGIKNFSQKVVLEALLTRRAELDATFDDLVFQPATSKPRATLSVRVTL